jgi:uncharacterized protein YfiM (DUF2279 family)
VFAVFEGLVYANDSIPKASFFQPAEDYNKERFYITLGGSGILYGGFAVGLYHAWYKDYPRSSFHLYNDLGEWKDLDKAGHLYSSYHITSLGFKMGKWTGLNDKKAMWTGLVSATLIMGTIEVMDGFSRDWGFSLPDLAANFTGAGLFVAQHALWAEQRLQPKFSVYPFSYSNIQYYSTDGVVPWTPRERAIELYGPSAIERMLKDYNSQTYWLSLNVHSFKKDAGIPRWLNIAVGYGAGNMLGGYSNQWMTDGHSFDAGFLPRYRSLYLSPDIDFSKVKTDSPFLKTLLGLLNLLKMPAPAIEYRSTGEWVFHLIRF